MNDFLSNIKRELNETSNEHATITLSRKDVEMLVKSYENKSETLMRHIADERKDVIERLKKNKKSIIVENGVIQKDENNDDYLFLLKDD